MTDRREHRKAAPVPSLRLRAVTGSSAGWCNTVRRVGAAYQWSIDAPSASGARRFWLIEIDGFIAGVVAVEPQPAGDVEIVAFGLVPEYIGKGYGAAALSRAIDIAWAQPPIDGQPIRRVWLHTSSLDHPHALPNYQQRGLRGGVPTRGVTVRS
jgi:RimJ/RimL family protein N-acetyltransferase